MIEKTVYLPTLVEQVKLRGEHLFLFKPLFIPHMEVSHGRYDSGLNSYKRYIRKLFKETEDQSLSASLWLWLSFNPNHQIHKLLLNDRVQNLPYNGHFTVVTFSVSSYSFGMLPAFDNYLFILSEDQTLEEQTKRVVRRRFKQALEEGDSDLDPSDYFTAKRAFTSIVECRLTLQAPKFTFNQRQSPLELVFGDVQKADFDGRDELYKVARNWNDKGLGQLQRAILRDQEAGQLHKLLFKKSTAPLVLVGEDGSGRHCLLQEALFQYLRASEGQAPPVQNLNQFWLLDPNQVIVGMSLSGAWEKRLVAILDYVVACENKAPIKLIVDNPLALYRVGKSRSGAMVLKDVIRPYLEKRQFQLILVATPDAWKIAQEHDRGFTNLFQVFPVTAASLEETYSMALHQRRTLEQEYGLTLPLESVKQLFVIHQSYLKAEALPGGVIRLMRELIAHPDIKKYVDNLFSLFFNSRGLETSMFDDNVVFDQVDLQKEISSLLIGQPKAVAALCQVIHLVKSRLNDIGRPLSSLLFIGPTGVGKTQAVKILSQLFYGHSDRLLRIDMNEYNDGSAVSRLIGSFQKPDGVLTRMVRKQPFGVLLLDEIEKAHPDVLDLFLQILDDARLSDSLGRTTDFTNLIIVMTSNQGASEIDSQIRLTQTSNNDELLYLRSIENHFRPEFINRIDQIISFQPLGKEEIFSIARLQIQALLRRDGFARRSMVMSISLEALEWVAERGYSKKLGGRELKRQIERDLTTLSANQLLQHANNDLLWFKVSLNNNQLVPEINSFKHAKLPEKGWLPDIPTGKQRATFLNQLHDTLVNLRLQLRNLSLEDEDTPVLESSKLDWIFFQLLQQLDELLDLVQVRLLRIQHPQHESYIRHPLRLRFQKGAKFTNLHSEELNKLTIQKQQTQAPSDLGDLYFNKQQTEYLYFLLKTKFLVFIGSKIIWGTEESFTLVVESAIEGAGLEQIDYLIQVYEAFLDSYAPLEVRDLSKLGQYKKSLEIKGYGLMELMQSETGIHFFRTPAYNALPIQVYIKEAANTEQKLRIIRYYQGGNIQDLRSQTAGKIHLDGPEFYLLLFAGLPPSIRSLMLLNSTDSLPDVNLD